MDRLVTLISVFITFQSGIFSAQITNPPHIIYILADDLGWNDVSYHGSDQIPTPNIDALAYNGVILNRYYVQPLCTPSRTSLMTGRYSVHTGQHLALRGYHASGLPLSIRLMPEYLKEMGYSTHSVGKWHLGFFNKSFTPLQRGFDSFFGYYTGFIGYYDHSHADIIGSGLNITNYAGLDLRRGYSPVWDLDGIYATDMFTKEAIMLIEDHPNEKPMFLYLPHLAVHAGNDAKQLEAPYEEIQKFSYISSPDRRTYAAILSKLDESVGKVVEALEKKDMLKNSIIVFASDNGASCLGDHTNWGSNYPLRGQKKSLWEGAIRVPAVIWSPLIDKPSRVSNELMHISDWLPTLLSAAGFDVTTLGSDIDGLDQWQVISKGYQSPRDSIPIDIYDRWNNEGYISGPFKYIKGARYDGVELYDDYLNFDIIFSKNGPKYDVNKISTSLVWAALQNITKNSNLKNNIMSLRNQSTIYCKHEHKPNFICEEQPCLFNTIEDPCEQKNIAKDFPILMAHIQSVINEIRLGKFPEDPYPIMTAESDPDLFNGTWDMWM